MLPRASIPSKIKKYSSSLKALLFAVEKKQGDSQQLQITLKTLPRTGADPRYLYIGYENAKGEVEYVCVYNKIDSLENIEEKKDSNGETY